MRGKILDRKNRILAANEPLFQLHINYRLSRFLDQRVREAMLLKADQKTNSALALSRTRKLIEDKLADLQQIIDKSTHFGFEHADIEARIKQINDRTWHLRSFLAWRRNAPQVSILKEYNNNIAEVPLSVALSDFKNKFPDKKKRLLLTGKVDDISELNKSWPFVQLKTDDDIFTAQLEFLDTDGIEIRPVVQRIYPFGPAAAQTIGWVGSVAADDKKLFADDKLSRYLEDELSGRDDGAEYVYESTLRGKRGEVIYDMDRRLISRTERLFGEDISLTLDIELQKAIEDYLTDCLLNPNCEAPTAAVVIDIVTGDILALASTPTFNLNRVRYDYGIFARDPNEPLRNRAINKQYPPGSVIKPLILVAALEAGQITAGEIISCPAQKAPKGWPSCWLYNRYRWTCHDDRGPNNARNAIRGSCNIYFSRLADKIEPAVLQKWLYNFGYGRKVLTHSTASNSNGPRRNFRQAQGQISNVAVNRTITDFEQLPSLAKAERRYFGIGQGNLRVTPLQVANAIAAIARGGLYRPPRLFIADANDLESESIALDMSPHVLNIVRDGMWAVVNQQGGTAYSQFAYANFEQQGIKVYGKTGSTEKPDHAWFAGFAEDNLDRSIAIAILVEGGQHGSSDAAPLAREIINYCIEAGYLGPSQGGMN